jgi:putative sigma-54 modulation protein
MEPEVGMEIAVRGKNVELSPRIRTITTEKVAKLSRFAHEIGRVEVDFSEVRNPRVADNQLCEVTVHLKRHFVKAHASASEAMAALDLVVDKVGHQLSRLKGKRVARSHPRRRRLEAYPLPALDDDDDLADGEALIVKTKRFALKPMRLEEAALQMDLLGHAFYLFTNAESGQAAVVYRRRDGHLGLIEASG